jgi:hypothetical protein
MLAKPRNASGNVHTLARINYLHQPQMQSAGFAGASARYCYCLQNPAGFAGQEDRNIKR